MQLDIALALSAILGIGCACYYALRTYKAEKWNVEKAGRLSAIVADTRKAVAEEKARRGKFSRVAAYSLKDGDFLNAVQKISERPEIIFVFDATHREIYEAAINAPTDEMILNAIGKGKGLRLIENKMRNPVTLFTEEVQDAEVQV